MNLLKISLLTSGNYITGTKEGRWLFYDENGSQLNNTGFYKDDILVKRVQ